MNAKIGAILLAGDIAVWFGGVAQAQEFSARLSGFE